MANQYKPLWIDPFENILYAGWQNTQSAPSLVFKQGDKIDIELFLVKRGISSSSQEEVEFPAGSTIRFAVGKLDTPPTAGTMVISYDGEQTGNIPHNSTAATIQTALNAVSTIASAGGVVVSVVSSTIFRIAFNEVGARPAPLLDTTGLSPTSSGKVITARVGTSTLPALYLFKVNQSVAVFQNNWVDSPQPTITATTLVANQTKRVTISPIPLSGTWTLSTTPSIARLVEDAGDEDDVPTYWTQTVSSRLGAFTSSFLGEDGRPIWNMSVIQIGSTSWDFTVRNDYDVPVGYTMPFTVDGNFTKFPSKVSTVNFDTVEVEYLLDGAESVTASLEIEVESPSGDKWTVLQTSCTIVNDLIDQANYTPLVLETLVTEAPLNGLQYARKNGDWVPVELDGNNIPDYNNFVTYTVGNQVYFQGKLYRMVNAAGAAGYDPIGHPSYWESLSGSSPDLSGYAPIVHTHTISDVLNLQSGLDNKANVSHNHNVFTLSGVYASGAEDGDMVRIFNPSLYGNPGDNLLISRPVTWWETPRGVQPMPNIVFSGSYYLSDGYGGYYGGNAQATISFSKYLNRLNTGNVTLFTGGINNSFSLHWQTGNPEGYYNFGSEYYGDTLNIEILGSNGVFTSPSFSDPTEGVAIQLGLDGSAPSSMTWADIIWSGGGQSATLPYSFEQVRPTSVDEPVMKRGLLQSFIQELNRFRAFSFTPSTSYPDYNLVWRSGTNKFELDNSFGASIDTLTNNFSFYALKSGTTFTGKVNFTATLSTAPLNIAPASIPSSTVNGDIWIGPTSNALSVRGTDGATRQTAMTGSQQTFTQPQVIATTTTATTPALRITNLSTTGTAHSLVVEDNTNPDTTSFIINNVGAVGIQKDPATWTHITGTALDVSGRAMFSPTTAQNPSLNLGATACNTAPTWATAGDIWITNATSPKLAFQTGGVNYYCVVANQFNTFTGQVAISGTSATNPQLAITQGGSANALTITTTGSGRALVVEDATSPDTTATVIDNAGNVGIGVNPNTFVATQKLEVEGAVKAQSITFDGTAQFKVNAVQSHTGGNDTHELLISYNGSTYKVGMTLVSTP